MGRKRLPEGTRKKDQIKTIIVKVPIEVFEEIEKKGLPSDILRQDAIKKYKISDC
ncbi:hypothetical protein PAEN_31570 [Paenibacillus amylolyticus]|nr:hypothetical protein [Paenibacillus amylolyticus]